MSNPFDEIDAALATLSDVVSEIDADSRMVEAAAAVDKCRCLALADRSPARAFFTHLALALEPVADRSIDTMATDGKRLLFNPEFTLGLSDAERYGVAMGHETMHVAMAHHARAFGWEDQELANVAGDLEINQLCREASYSLPKGALFPGEGEYRDLKPGLSMEEYYATLMGKKQAKQGQPEPQPGDGDFPGPPGDGDGDGNGPPSDQPGKPGSKSGNDPGCTGGFIPCKDQAAADAAKAHWDGLVAGAAQQAASRGDLPDGIQRLVDRVLKPKVDPWEILREFMTRHAKSETSWARLNRRHLARGLYLPSRRSEELGNVVLLVDTSGSIGDEELAKMAGFLEGVLSANPGKLTVLYHTTTVYREQEWEPDAGPLVLEKLQNGGTDHRDCFQQIIDRDLDPAVIIALTDMYSVFPEDPGIPTIWVNVDDNGIEAPFGQIVCIK